MENYVLEIVMDQVLWVLFDIIYYKLINYCIDQIYISYERTNQNNPIIIAYPKNPNKKIQINLTRTQLSYNWMWIFYRSMWSGLERYHDVQRLEYDEIFVFG